MVKRDEIKVLFCEAGHHGGSVKRAGHILNHLMSCGVDCSLLTFFITGRVSELFSLGLNGHSTSLGLNTDPAPDPIIRRMHLYLPTFFGIRYFFRSLFELMKVNPSVVYMNNTPFCHLPMIASCSLFRIPTICHMRDSVIITKSELLALKFVTKIVVLSKTAKKFYADQGVPTNKMVVIYNGISLNDFKCKNYSLGHYDDSWIRLILVGTLVDRKKQSTAIELIEKLVIEFPNIHLSLLGDGPDRKGLEKMVKEKKLEQNVDFFGQQKDVVPYLLGSDIGLMLSDREGMPNVVLEYMAAALPVVVTDLPGVSEMVEDGVSGLVVPLGDLDALIESVRQLLADTNLRLSMGNAGYRCLENKMFTIEQEMLDVENVILNAKH